MVVNNAHIWSILLVTVIGLADSRLTRLAVSVEWEEADLEELSIAVRLT
jgi:hypothetical protein